MRKLKSIGIVSLSTLLSRILGLVRDVLLASTFGAGAILDAFVLAFTIPNLFRRFFGEGVLSAAFIPSFTQVLKEDGKENASRLLSNTASLLGLFLTVCVAIGICLCLFCQYFFSLSEKNDFALGLTAFLLPYVIFICLVALLSAALQALRQFLFPALAPVLLNIFWLVGILAAQTFGDNAHQWIYIMSSFILIGGVFQVFLQLPALYKNKISLSFDFSFKDSRLRSIVQAVLTGILGVAVIQVNILLDRLIAWFFIPGEGALTVLYMGNRLMQFPLAIIGISIATVVFPIFAQYAVQGKKDDLAQAVTDNMKLTFFLSLPCSLGLVLLAEPIVALIYQHNNFSIQDAQRTSSVLLVYSSGIWIYSLLQIITKVFYSINDVKTPVKIASYNVLGNIILNLILVQFLAEMGLALATVLSALINIIILLFLLKKRVDYPWKNSISFIVKTLICGGVMSFLVYKSSQYFHDFSSLESKMIAVFIPVVVGVISYFISSFFLGMKELKRIIR